MKTKKIISLCLVLLMIFSFLTIGMESTSAATLLKDEYFGDEQNAKIKLWVPDAYKELAIRQSNDFVSMFPERNITIDIRVQGEDVAATQMLSDPEAAADVFGFASDQLHRLVDACVIAPIAPTFAKDIKKTHYKKAVNACTVDDTLYAIPETGNSYYLVYDKRVVSAKQSKSLEKILKACKKADKKFIMEASTGYYSCSVAFAGGLKTNGLKANSNIQKFNKYDKKTVVATLQAFSKLTHKYSSTFVSLGVYNISSKFTNGTAGAGIDGCWNSTANKKALGKNFGAAKLPTITVNNKKRPLVSMYGYKMIGVNAISKYPQTSQLLAYYLSTNQVQKERMKELDWSPTIKAIGSSKVAKKNVAISALIKQMKNSVTQVQISDLFWNPMSNMGYELISLDTDPDTYNFKKLLNKTIKIITAE